MQQSITLLCWLHPENTDGPIFHYIGDNGVWGVHMWILWGKLMVRFKKSDYSNTPSLVTTTLLPLNKWHYVGSSYDHMTGIASLWLNNKRVVQQNIGAGLTLGTQDNVRMGALANDDRSFFGRITAVQVFDTALTAKQIYKVKKTGLGRFLCYFVLFFFTANRFI